VKITLAEFARLMEAAPVTIHALDGALYLVSVEVSGASRLLTQNSGRPLRRRNLTSVRELLQTLPVSSLTLRQESAYDEMIGQPLRGNSNAMEIALSLHTDKPGDALPGDGAQGRS